MLREVLAVLREAVMVTVMGGFMLVMFAYVLVAMLVRKVLRMFVAMDHFVTGVTNTLTGEVMAQSHLMRHCAMDPRVQASMDAGVECSVCGRVRCHMSSYMPCHDTPEDGPVGGHVGRDSPRDDSWMGLGVGTKPDSANGNEQ